jgi:hypothetical protein
MQLSAAIAGTLKTLAVRNGNVATLFADKPSVQMRHQGPELDAKHAIGTAHDF